MLIEANEILPFRFRTSKAKVNTNISLDWFQASDNNWLATDWGEQSDYYETVITTYGTEDYINGIIDNLNIVRTDGDYTLFLSEFVEDEDIFGADIDYNNSLSAYPISYSLRESTSWKGYTFEIGLRLITPTFKQDITEWSWSNICINHLYIGDRDWDVRKIDTYNSKVYMFDHEADTGNCEITMNINNDDMASLREYRRLTRSDLINLPLGCFGVDYPFGPKSSQGPHQAKILEMEEERTSPFRYNVKLKLVEYIT